MNPETQPAPDPSIVPEPNADDSSSKSTGHARANGKIARLPKTARDQINRWILDGVTYPDIIYRLGPHRWGQPMVCFIVGSSVLLLTTGQGMSITPRCLISCVSSIPAGCYHIMSRGDRGERIFLDDVDRHDIIKTLAELWRGRRKQPSR